MRIAIVEDDSPLAADLQEAMIEDGHTVVGIARSAIEGVRLIEAAKPALAIVDLELHNGSSGLDVAKGAHQRGVATLFITSRPAGCEPAKAFALGCLPKPFRYGELAHAVRYCEAVIAKQAPRQPPAKLLVFA